MDGEAMPKMLNHNLISCAIVEMGVVHTLLRLLADQGGGLLGVELEQAAETILTISQASYVLSESGPPAPNEEVADLINKRIADIVQCAVARSMRPGATYHKAIYQCDDPREEAPYG